MRRRILLLVGVPVALTVVGCTRGRVNDAGVYCDALRTNEPLLLAEITNELDIAPRVSLYEVLRDGAPLEIEEDWQEVIDLVNAAASVDLTDQAAVLAVQDQAFSTARSAQAIVEQAQRVCGITLPAVGQLAPAASTIVPPPPTTTTNPDAPPAAT